MARETVYLRDQEATQLRREIYTLLERIEEIDGPTECIGPALSGNWITRELADGRPALGNWIARRQE